MTVSVIVVSYNTRELTIGSLRSVLETSSDVVSEVVVVDNASSDGSAAAIRDALPEVRVVALLTNVGFGVACNLAVTQTSGDYVLLLNPDTEMRPGCVHELLDLALRRPEAGLVGGRTFDETGALDPHSCWGQPTLWSMTCFAVGLSTAFRRTRFLDPESLGRWNRDDEREVGVVTGCLLLCGRPLWDRLGGMEPTYFMYGEDVDFSFRARRLGYHPMITPRAEMMHIRGASSRTSAAKWQMILRGKVTFMRRCWSPVRQRMGIALLVVGVGLRAGAARAGLHVQGPWKENWSSRRDWLGGWEVQEPVPIRIAGPNEGQVVRNDLDKRD